MASGQFFDPMTALRAAPLVSATCTLLFAWDQRFFLSGLNRPETRAASKPLLRPYFTHFFYRGTAFVLAYVVGSTATGLANLRTQRGALHARGSFAWYAAGAVCAAAHLLFVPAIAPSCQAIIDSREDDGVDVNAWLDEWLAVHTLRMLTVDVAAWVSFAVAVTKTLRA